MSRSKRGALAVWVAASSATVLAACGLDLVGLGSATGDDASTGQDATMTDGPSSGSDAGPDVRDAVVDSVAVKDVHVDAEGGAIDSGAPDACDAGAPENCSNGIDDNCDGLVDCADPYCQTHGFACAPATPAGWTLVAYDQSGRPTCPAGWSSSSALVEAPDGGAGCACTCGPLLGDPCREGTATMSLGESTCSCGSVQNVSLLADGGCNALPSPIGAPCSTWGDGKVKPVGVTGVGCGEQAVLPLVTFGAQGETCLSASTAGAGCAASGACLPTAAPGLACVESSADVPCPAGFTQRHVAYAPSNVVDQRACGACGCTSAVSACTGATLTLFNDPGCTANPVVLTADDSCDTFVGDPSDAGWFRYSAVPNAGCAGPALGPIDGGLLLRAPVTICCP